MRQHTRLASLLTALLTAAALLLHVVPALAQEDMSVEDLEGAAAEAYGEGNYKKAIQLMVRANQLQPHPNYLLNIAVSYSKLGDCENARLWAQNAIAPGDTALPPEAVATAESIIDECEKIISDTDPKDVNNGKITPPDDGKGDPVEGPETRSDGLAWRPITAYALLGAGGLTTLLTVILDASVSSDIDDLRKLSTTADKTAFDELKASIQSDQTLVWVGYTAGILMLASGGGLLVWDLLDPPGAAPATGQAPAPRTSIGPWLSPEAGGIVVQGRF